HSMEAVSNLASPPPIQFAANMPMPTTRAAIASPTETPTPLNGRPSAKAAGKKATISAPETQFGIFIVVRSCTAAMTAKIGKIAKKKGKKLDISRYAPHVLSSSFFTTIRTIQGPEHSAPALGIQIKDLKRPLRLRVTNFTAKVFGEIVKRRGEVIAQQGHSPDDRHGDQSRDQAVFDGRGAGFVFGEAIDEVTHDLSSFV